MSRIGKKKKEKGKKTDLGALLAYTKKNSQSSDLINYASSAATATANTPAKQVAGGIAAFIPLANALVPTAPAATPAATAGLSTRPQQQSLSTRTVTAGGSGSGSGNGSAIVATATVTGAASRVGGGTATAFATVVVGPSGVIAATTRRGNGTATAGVAGATGQPVAAVPFTGGAAGGRKTVGELTSVLVMAGMLVLGTMVLDARQ